MAIAFFDIDNTLIKGNSGFYKSLLLMKYGLLKQRRLLQAAYFSIASLVFSQDVKKIYQLGMKDMVGSQLSHVLQIGRDCFEKDIKKRLYLAGIEQIQFHKKQKDRVVLLTAAPYALAKAMQEYLGMDEVYSITADVIGGVVTAKLDEPICYGEGKVHYAKIECRKQGVKLSDCYFYTDHHSDIPLLSQVGYPRAVNPTRKLKKTAFMKGWPVFRWQERVGT